MTMDEARALRKIIEQASQGLDDKNSLMVVYLHPHWSAGQAYTAGFKAQRGGRLWRCLQAHTSQDGWEPENAPALWTEICETHGGTLTDPIPYSGNMALEAGLYYVQGGVTYLCTRDTVNPVYSDLDDLVGLYVERSVNG